MPSPVADIGTTIGAVPAPRSRESNGEAQAFARLMDDSAAEDALEAAAPEPKQAAKPQPKKSSPRTAAADDEPTSGTPAESVAGEIDGPVAETKPGEAADADGSTAENAGKDAADENAADPETPVSAAAVVVILQLEAAVAAVATTDENAADPETPVSAAAVVVILQLEAAVAAVATTDGAGIEAGAAIVPATPQPGGEMPVPADLAASLPIADLPPLPTAKPSTAAAPASTPMVDAEPVANLLTSAVSATADATAGDASQAAGAGKPVVTSNTAAGVKPPNAFVAAGLESVSAQATPASSAPAASTALTSANVTLLALETAEEAKTEQLPVTQGQAVSAGSTDDALQGFRAVVHAATDTTQIATAGTHAANRAASRPIPVMEQVVTPVFKAVSEGINRIAIELKPASLGKIEVELEISPDSRVVARVIADRPETIELIRRESHQLERALQDAGLKTDSESMTFDLRGNRADDRENNRPGRQPRGFTDPLAGDDAIVPETAAILPARRGGGLALIDVSI